MESKKNLPVLTSSNRREDLFLTYLSPKDIHIPCLDPLASSWPIPSTLWSLYTLYTSKFYEKWGNFPWNIYFYNFLEVLRLSIQKFFFHITFIPLRNNCVLFIGIVNPFSRYSSIYTIRQNTFHYTIPCVHFIFSCS